MAIATFKDLCVDAVDPVALGGSGPDPRPRLAPARRRRRRLDGPTPQHAGLGQQGARAGDGQAAGAHRRPCGLVDEVLALGATPEDLDSFRWKVLRDPEGGEMCVFEREEVPGYRLYEIVVDSVDPARDRALVGRGARRDRPGQRRGGGVLVRGGPWHAVRLLVFGRCPSRRRSRTGSTGTSTAATSSAARPRRHGAPRADDASRGTSWPTRRATSSARSPAK